MKLFRIAIPLALVLVLAACGQSPDTEASPSPSVSPSTSPSPSTALDQQTDPGQGRPEMAETGEVLYGEVTQVAENEYTLKLIEAPDTGRPAGGAGGPPAGGEAPDGTVPGGDGGDNGGSELSGGVQVPDIPAGAGVTFEFDGEGGPGGADPGRGGDMTMPEFELVYTGEETTVTIPAELVVMGASSSGEIVEGNVVAVSYGKDNPNEIVRVMILK